jgi:hypothetical protein
MKFFWKISDLLYDIQQHVTMVKEIYGRWKGRKLYEKLLINYEK